MRGKTRGEAREELMKAGVKGEELNALIPHKVRVIFAHQSLSMDTHLVWSDI